MVPTTRPDTDGAVAILRLEGQAIAHFDLGGAQRGTESGDGLAPGIGRGGGEQPQAVAQRILGHVGIDRDQALEVEAVGGQGAGLVQAQGVDGGHGLDGAQALHDGAAAGQTDGAEDEGQGGHQHQALGDHRRDGGGDHLEQVPLAQVARRVQDDVAAAQDHGGGGQDADEAVDALLHRAGGIAVGTGLGRGALGEGSGADALGGVGPLAGDAEAARQNLLPDPARYRVRLAGQKGLVHLEEVGRAHGAVGDHGLARGQEEAIAAHHVAAGDLADDAVAHGPDLRVGQQGELVEMALGPHLLDEAEDGVGDGHAADGGAAAPVADGEQGQRCRHHKGVEERQRVASQDVEVLGAIGAAHAVDLAPRGALGDLGGGQSLGRRLGHRLVGFVWRGIRGRSARVDRKKFAGFKGSTLPGVPPG